MARFRYFSDIGSEPVELHGPHGMDNKEFAERFPGVRGRRYDGFHMWVGHPVSAAGAVLPVTRMIDYKRQPSLHACNAKCLNGKHNGVCECQCGGRNHGRGTVLLARP